MTSLVSGYGPSVTVPSVATTLARWLSSPPLNTNTPASLASWTTASALDADQATDRLSCPMVKILSGVSELAGSRQVITVAAVTDSTRPDMTHDSSGERPAGARRRKQYLPSAQVVQELSTLGPDLSKLAEELRRRLSDSGD
jgi:hypothetical protein